LIHNDHLATPQKMTNSNGVVVWAADYKPFGEVNITTNTITNNLRFPGQYYDAETGLNYNARRDYNPALGRYIETDPAGLTSDKTLYVYAQSNPLRYIDPLGLACQLVSSVLVGNAHLGTSITTQYSGWQFVSWAPVSIGCVCTWKKTGVTRTTQNYADIYRDTYRCQNGCNNPYSYTVDRPANPTSETTETPLPEIWRNNWGTRFFNPGVGGESAGDVEAGNDCTCRYTPPSN
jgi:RHS repeat-associated protein